LRYEDLVRAADVVVTKPGYGIISEAIANSAALLYTSRGHFVEYDVLVREMPRYLRAEFLEQKQLLSWDWSAALERLLSQAPPPETPALNGAEIAAEEILRLVTKNE
jgi:L-arabinokinase